MDAALKRRIDPETAIEAFYLTESRRNIYTSLENNDHLWSYEDIRKVEDAYEQDVPIDMIADALGRHVDEVASLIMSRVQEARLKPRVTGAYGFNLPFDPEGNAWLTEGQKLAIVRILLPGAKRSDVAQAVGIPVKIVNYVWSTRREKVNLTEAFEQSL